ncbi:hypothetical protein [Allosphingosinicella sp.]|jgi:hypothetical protein|uniref:hypothetical protein n=1 Tax=Allosphingosinicella sp. TaxID=2823234 RepID=UPI002F062B42
MSLLCFVQGHSPSSEEVWNRGYSFAKCRRCECDMIRSDGDWEPVPRGHRVVWKKGPHQHSRSAGYVRNLPVLYRDSGGKVPAPWFGGWYKHVLLLAGGGTAERLIAPAAALDDSEPESTHYPYLLAFAAVAAAGLQLLFASRPGRNL